MHKILEVLLDSIQFSAQPNHGPDNPPVTYGKSLSDKDQLESKAVDKLDLRHAFQYDHRDHSPFTLVAILLSDTYNDGDAHPLLQMMDTVIGIKNQQRTNKEGGSKKKNNDRIISANR